VEQIKNADEHQISQPHLFPTSTIYQNMEYVKFSVFE